MSRLTGHRNADGRLRCILLVVILYGIKVSKDPLCVGDSLEPATPLPIPNREVKRFKIDDTCGFACWESRFRQHIRGFFAASYDIR